MASWELGSQQAATAATVFSEAARAPSPHGHAVLLLLFPHLLFQLLHLLAHGPRLVLFIVPEHITPPSKSLSVSLGPSVREFGPVQVSDRPD